jgi:hypothetical protein
VSEQRLGLIEKRVDVMQQEIRQALAHVANDLEAVMQQVMGVMAAFDARLQVLEATKVSTAGRVDTEGKEL